MRNQKKEDRMFVGLVVCVVGFLVWCLVFLPFPFLDISGLMKLMRSKWRRSIDEVKVEEYCGCDLDGCEFGVRYGWRYDAGDVNDDAC